MTVLTNARTRSTSLLADSGAARNAALFVESVLAEWGLGRLESAAAECVMELAAWAVANGAGVLVEIGVVWDGPLLFTEVSDRCAVVPFRPAWLEADRRAVACLERGCLEWDAEVTSRGRCLWASFLTGCPDPAEGRAP